MASHDASFAGKLAARFGGGTIAKQAARQALVNRSKHQKDGKTGGQGSSSGTSIPLGQPASTTPASNKAAAMHGTQAAGVNSSSPSSNQCSRSDSVHTSCSQAADESISSELDEIMGVMEALGGAQRDPAACCPSDVQRQPEPPHLPPRSDDTLQCSSTAIANPASSSRGNSRSPVKRYSTDRSSSQQQDQLRAEHQTASSLQQSEHQLASFLVEQQKQQQQQLQGTGSKPSSPIARHTRASMLSSKVPPGKGLVTAVKPAVFNFDEAHPVLAEKHYLRTKEQERMLSGSRPSSPSSSSTGSKGQLMQSPTRRRPGTAQPASAAGSPLNTQRHWASSSDALRSGAGFSTSIRPKSAVVLRCKASSNSDAAAFDSPVAAVHGSLAASAAAFEQHGAFLSSSQRHGSVGLEAEAHLMEVDAARSASSSTGGSIAARQELLRVMKQAQQAMAASAHLRTRQNTHLPAASSSLASKTSCAAAAAAAAAADALASRGVVTAGNRPGRQEVGTGQTWSNITTAGADAVDKDRQIQELASKVGHLEGSLALLLSCQTLPADAAAALTTALGKHGVLSAEQLHAVAVSTGRADELEDVIGTVNQGEGLMQLQKPSRQQQQQQCSRERQRQQQGDSEVASGADPNDKACASNSSSDSEVSRKGAAAEAAAASEESDSEMRVACGAFHEERYEEFNKQLDVAMQRRAAEQDYDSDLEEEEKAAIRANGDAAEALLELQEAERQLEELNGQQVQLQAIWAEQDEWMDEYRQPSEQQQQQRQQCDAGETSGSEAGSEEEDNAQHTEHHCDMQRHWHDSLHAAADAAAARGRAAAESAAAAAAARGQTAAAAAAATCGMSDARQTARAERSSASEQHQVLSLADEALISMPFIPHMEQSLPPYSTIPVSLAANREYQQQQQHQSTLDNPSACDLQQQQVSEVCGYSSDNGSGYCSRQARNREMGAPNVCSKNRAGGSYASKAQFSMRSHSASPHFKTTIAKPFAFKATAATKPKSIAAVKLEQDLVLKAQEEEAHYRLRFVASPIPASTLEPRYLNIIADQATKRAASRTRYQELLASQECPFTFYERDKEAAAAKAARRAAAKNPNRFQRPFKAKPVPAHVHERRYESTAVGLEAARLAAKVRAEMAREKAAAKLQEAYKKRQELAEATYRERLTRSSSNMCSPTAYRRPWHASGTNVILGNPMQTQMDLSKSTSALQQQQQKAGQLQEAYPTLHSDGSGIVDCSPSTEASLARRAPSAGCSLHRATSASGQYYNPVPDFKALHAQWEAHMAAIKAANRRRVTVPEEFRLNGSTVDEQAERARKQAERRARIVATMEEDAHNLKELRWPYVSSRAPVHPTPPPALFTESVWPKSADVGGTLAAQLRAEMTRQAMAAGKFDSKEERERKQWEAMKAEQQERQQQWQAVQASELRKRLEQHQQQLEHQRQKRLQQGLPSTSTTGGGSATDQSRGMSAAGADGATTATAAFAAATGKAALDAAAAAAAGRAMAAASAAEGGPPPSAAEVAAQLDQLLKGKVTITPAQLDHQELQQQHLPREVAFGSTVDYNGSSSSGSSPRKSSSSPCWMRQMMHGSKQNSKGNLVRRYGDAAASCSTGGRLSSTASPVTRRACLSGRVEAPLMHIEARHAQAEKAARGMVEDALLQQGIEAYRYVEG